MPLLKSIAYQPRLVRAQNITGLDGWICYTVHTLAVGETPAAAYRVWLAAELRVGRQIWRRR